MRSEGFFTYSRGAYINFLHEERKMRRLFFARRPYSTHFTRRVEKKYVILRKVRIIALVADNLLLRKNEACTNIVNIYVKK